MEDLFLNFLIFQQSLALPNGDTSLPQKTWIMIQNEWYIITKYDRKTVKSV